MALRSSAVSGRPLASPAKVQRVSERSGLQACSRMFGVQSNRAHRTARICLAAVSSGKAVLAGAGMACCGARSSLLPA